MILLFSGLHKYAPLAKFCRMSMRLTNPSSVQKFGEKSL